MSPNYRVNLCWLARYLRVRGLRVVDVARILHVRQTFVKKVRHISVDDPVRPGRVRKMNGNLAFKFANKLNRSMK